MRHVLGIDLETFCEADLKAVGAHRYAEDPSFEVMLFGYAWDDEDPVVVDLTAGEELPPDVLDALYDPDVIKAGWNIAFERACLTQHLGRVQPAEQWEDTMVLASVCGLPLGLGDCGQALKLPADKAKDREGKALIRWFCKPCKPTKTKPDRTRHMPGDYPDKWCKFVSYNGQDVVAERAIRKLLERWRPTGQERRIWVVDQAINDRGIRVDMTLARAAVDMDRDYKARLTQEAIDLTGMTNPGSVAQVKAWLQEQEGIEVASLNKKVMPDVVASLSTDKARQFMAIRKELARSSTAKFDAMVRSACADGHIRGCFQFCGAGRTGRWAGRRVQLQNLSKNKMNDLEACRALVRTGDLETTELLYEDISSTLSELVRTALIPEEGERFIVCDYSAIEARVLAWIAGEEWALEEFRGKGQIYEATGAMMFHVPKETIAKGGVNHHRRQPAKTAVLACVAEGQLVLTNRGPVPIEQITLSDKVWDGESWVRHEGLIRRGVRETVLVNGVELTPDHKIYTERGMVPCVEAEGLNWTDIRVPDSPWTCAVAAARERTESDNVAVSMCMRQGNRSVHRASDAKEKIDQVLRVHVESDGRDRAYNTRHDQHEPVQCLESDAPPMHKSGRRELPQIRGTRCYCVRSLDGELYKLPGGYGANLREGTSTGEDRQRKGILPGKLHLGDQSAASEEQTEQHSGGHPGWTNDTPGAIGADRSDVRCIADPVLPEKAVTIRRGRRAVETFDLLNAGPRHRFCLIDRITGVLRCVSNCGYGGGVNALLAFGADKMGMSDADMVETVDLWRQANPHVVSLWKDLERAAIRCVVRGTPQVSKTGGIRFDMDHGILWMTLPSGRRIAYFGAQYAKSKWKDGKVLSYMGIGQKSHKWERLETWGGKLTENCWGGETPVLTDRGWVPIRDITCRDLLWDGVSWVTHGGVVHQGWRPVICLDGLTVTSSHKILTTEGWRRAEACNGLDRLSVQLPDGPETWLHRGRAWTGEVGCAMPVRKRIRDGHSGFEETGEGREADFLWLHETKAHLRGTQNTRNDEASGIRRLEVHEGQMRKPETPGLEELRRAWDHSLRTVGKQLRKLLGRYGANIQARSGFGPRGQQCGVFPGELPLGQPFSELPEQEGLHSSRDTRGPAPAKGISQAVRGEIHNTAVSAGARLSAREINDPREREKPVYDILNAGPRHRYVVLGSGGPILAHNCVQATARDCLRDAMVALSDAGFQIRAHIHDEVVISEPIYGRTLEDVAAIMGRSLPWAPGLPLRGDGYYGSFYFKD